MTGEHFDLIRSYINNYQTFYKRNYNKLESVPTNLLPILADSLGWNTSQTFEMIDHTGSLSEYFGTSAQDIRVGGRTAEELKHNTWRKVLNNLIYIYKTKGTLSGVRALLNTYGYPADVLKLQEIGGSTQEHNPAIITDDIEKLLKGVGGSSGNVSFIKFVDELYSWIFNNDNSRILNFDWWINKAVDLNTIEFILKPHKSNNDQIILESSGSGTEKFWDLRLLSGSDAISGSLQFRLNNSHSGSNNISGSAVSMSTEYLPFKAGPDLWNVMLQRMTSSISGTGIQEYKLFTGLQDGDKITQFSAVSMSISGGLAADNPSGSYYANQNWLSTGSRHYQSGSNLYVGTTYTGSLAEFRTWTTALSASKFKQHILNKKSTVGNNIDASRDEVTYRYALQENWKQGVSTPQIKDSNPKNVSDYTFNINTDLLTGSVLYDKDEIDIVKFSVRIGGVGQYDDHRIISNPKVDVVWNLNPKYSSITTPYHFDRFGNKSRYHTNELQIVRSPQKILNEFIIDNLADYDITGKFGDPQDLYEIYYNDLNNLRDDLFNHFNVTIDINKWIRAQANIFNPSIIEAMQSVLPARSTIQNVGVMFEPTLLERDKIKNPQASVATGSAAGYLETERDIIQYYNLDDSAYVDYKTNLNPIDIASNISLVDSIYISSKDAEYSIADLIEESVFYIDTKNAEYNVESNIIKEISYQPSKNAEYNVENNITKEISYNPSKDAEYNVESNITKEISYNPSKDAEYNVESTITEEISYNPSKDIEYDIEDTITKEMFLEPFYSIEYNITDNITETSNIENIIEGSDSWIASQSHASFVNLADSWGTSSEDVHFLALSATGSKLENIGYYEQDFVFKIVGDIEFIIGNVEMDPFDYEGDNRMDTYRANYRNMAFDNPDFFLNKEIRDKGKGYVYKSYVRSSSNDSFEGLQDGRPVGKTSYYVTRSNGELVYPSNHWIHFSEEGLRANFIKGTQNIGGHFMQLNTHEDYSTEAYYSIETAGADELIVRRGKSIKKDDGTVS